MRDQLIIFVNGQRVPVQPEDVFLPLSEFLRKRRRLTGTKVVCSEGDCGACAVLVGRPDVSGGQIKYASVNSCIQMTFQLDGAHVVTVEGLNRDGKLNPIQSAMVDCQGTQCGFCTPGFVVSLYDLMQGKRPLDAGDVKRGLVGNLCRCTGYDSIIRAAMETETSSLASMDQLYPPGPILAELSRAVTEEVRITDGDRVFYKPVTIEQAVQFRAENPSCQIVSGATDLGVQCNKGTRELKTVLSIGGIAALRGVNVEGGLLIVGATSTLTDLERAAERHLPELAEFLERFGSPLIRNSGTLAGNLVNGSPIGDCICALFALETTIELTSVRGTRQIPIESFYTGYRQTVLAADEIVTGVRIALSRAGEIYKLYKISKRTDLDISSFAAAIWMARAGRTITDVRIAYGGVAPMVIRMTAAEAVLRGGAASFELFEQAAVAAADAVKPISDVRGSADYRRRLAHNVLLKFWNDLDEPDAAPAGPVFREPALQRSPEQLP